MCGTKYLALCGTLRWKPISKEVTLFENIEGFGKEQPIINHCERASMPRFMGVPSQGFERASVYNKSQTKIQDLSCRQFVDGLEGLALVPYQEIGV